MKDLKGQVFGRLTVFSFKEIRNKKSIWECKCECGKIVSIIGTNLTSKHTQSCGCLLSDKNKKRLTTHGLRKHPLYKIYDGMVQRCYNEKSTRYNNYGGRGIKVCRRWKESIQNFIDDMGDRPSLNHTLDRKDVNGDYTPENCKWATYTEQNRNQTNNVYLSYLGEEKLLIEWCEFLDLNYSEVYNRLYNNWNIVQALTTPTKNKFKKTKNVY